MLGLRAAYTFLPKRRIALYVRIGELPLLLEKDFYTKQHDTNNKNYDGNQ